MPADPALIQALLTANPAVQQMSQKLGPLSASAGVTRTPLPWTGSPTAPPGSPAAQGLLPQVLPDQLKVVVDHKLPVSPNASKAVELAKQYLGTPYVWGGDKPGGFDCSGLVMYVNKLMGIDIPHYSGDQWKTGKQVPKNQLQPGDAVFFHPDSSGVPQHEGMYIGHDQFIEAPHTGDVVKIVQLSKYSGYLGARRFS